MTKSDNPNGTGGNYGQPPRQPNYGQPGAPIQPGVDGYPQDPQQMVPNPELPVGQAYQPGVEVPYQAGQVPGQQQMAGQLPPQVPTEHYGDYVSPQVPPAPQMPVFGEEPQMDAGYAPQAPLDDYQYPQGQPIMPEVPSVAVPPAMAPVAGQPMHASHQGAETGYIDPAAVGGSGEQISQRLAQLQSQYDEEMAGENWNAEQNAQQIPAQNMPQGNEAYTGYQAPQAEDQQQQLYQQVPPQQTYQQAPEAYQQEQPQAQYAQPSMTAPQAPYGEYGNPSGEAQQPFGQTDPNHAVSSSIAEEPAGGGGMGKLMLGGAFVVALAVGGGGAYVYQYTDLLVDHQGSASAPTIKAAGSPIKILKKKIAGAKESINKAMHSRLSGGSNKTSMLSGGSSSEKLVQKTLNGAKEAGNKVAAANSGMLPELDRMNSGTSTRVNAPRRVRTLIVRPDGTILRPAGADDSATSMAVAPGFNAADIPKAEDVAKTSGNKIRRIKTIGEANIARRLGGSAGSSVKKAAVKSQTREVVRKVVPVKPVATPKVRTAAVSVPVRGDIGTPFVVQVTSRSSQTSALAAFADMQQKYPSLIGSYTPDIQRADLGTKGVWYRLRVGPVGSKTAATDLCSSLKQAGHPGCFVRRK